MQAELRDITTSLRPHQITQAPDAFRKNFTMQINTLKILQLPCSTFKGDEKHKKYENQSEPSPSTEKSLKMLTEESFTPAT